MSFICTHQFRCWYLHIIEVHLVRSENGRRNIQNALPIFQLNYLAIREFERSRNLPATPIVALTAHALQEHRDAVFASGMNHYLSKPITLDNLIAAFERIVYNKP
ncbi:MAG: response regulator [Moraxellaceae bacterium]|nr:MAG: response regulator [Moraxellaceae bacterium]